MLSLQSDLIERLEIYLNDQYRSKFGRFYFLSNDELVDLISFGLDPRCYSTYVRRLFRGVDRVNFQLGQKFLSTMNNSQSISSAVLDVYGDSNWPTRLRSTIQQIIVRLAYRLEAVSIENKSSEKLKLLMNLTLALPKIDPVSLTSHLISSVSLVDWFQRFEHLMKYSLAKSIFDLIDKRTSRFVDENYFRRESTFDDQSFPFQVVRLVSFIEFENSVERAWLSTTRRNSSLQTLKFVVVWRNNQLTVLILSFKGDKSNNVSVDVNIKVKCARQESINSWSSMFSSAIKSKVNGWSCRLVGILFYFVSCKA